MTFEDIEKRGLVLYRYIRGSHAYGLTKDDNTSDVDEGGVYIEPEEWLLGIGYDYIPQIHDKSNDKVWYSLKEYMHLLSVGNINVIESLFIDEQCIIYEHPLFKLIKENRDLFVTKQCLRSVYGYAKSQIKKATGLHKMMNITTPQRLYTIDCCYTFNDSGSQPIIEWLNNRGMKQELCGLVNIPHMKYCYAVYYDWAVHFQITGKTPRRLKKIFNKHRYKSTKSVDEKIKQTDNRRLLDDLYQERENILISSAIELFLQTQCTSHTSLIDAIESLHPCFYRGIVCDVQDETSNVRLSSIPTGQKPICYMVYNQDAYGQHCKDWKRYQTWLDERNKERYNENVAGGQQMDLKNMMHCVRLLTMGVEIATTGQVNVNRGNIDRDKLMAIRKGLVSYDEIMEYVNSVQTLFDNHMDTIDLPLQSDTEKLNHIMMTIRKQWKQ